MPISRTIQPIGQRINKPRFIDAGVLRAAGSSVLAVSGRANANVSMASTGSFVAAVWAATLATGTTDIYASVSRDGGAAFTAPVRVNSTAGDARANGEQPPRVALTLRPGNAPEINVVWLAKRGMATVLLSARSIDGGRSFSASTLVSGTDAAGNRGWQSLAADSRGAVHAAWLDHRKLALPFDGRETSLTDAEVTGAKLVPELLA